jgi:hypothetical protein
MPKLFSGRPTKSIALALVALVSLTGVLAPGCRTAPAEEVTFEGLFSNPERYNGREITLEGFYFHGFETIVLAERLALSGYAEGHLIPAGKMLWVEGGIPLDIYNRLYIQSMMGPEERYGKLRITGVFSYGGQYGHLGGSDAQITPRETELLDWAP